MNSKLERIIFYVSVALFVVVFWWFFCTCIVRVATDLPPKQFLIPPGHPPLDTNGTILPHIDNARFTNDQRLNEAFSSR